MKNKNALNPYYIESEEYYFLREILAPRGIDVPDERKRIYRARLAQHIDPPEKSAHEFATRDGGRVLLQRPRGANRTKRQKHCHYYPA